MVNDVAKELLDYGVLGLVLLAIIWAIWKASKYLADKLFDAKTGLLVRYVNDNQAFLRAMEKRDIAQQSLCRSNSQLIEQVSVTVADTGRGVRQLKSAMGEGCELCSSVCEDHSTDGSQTVVRGYCDRIQRILAEEA